MPREKLIQFRRGLASQWASVNPILKEGESGYETDTKKIKVGDGVTAWNSLGYITQWGSGSGGGGGSSWGEITGTLSSQTDLQSALDGKADASDIFSGDYDDLINKPTILTNTTASFTTSQEAKLSGIEVNATADQTGAEIVSAIDIELGQSDWKSGGGGAPTFTRIRTRVFSGVVAAAQNIHGAGGSTQKIGWNPSTNNASYIVNYTAGDVPIVFSIAGNVKVDVSVGAINAGLNNRQTYCLVIRHYNSAGEQLDVYYGDDTYIRDDANAYDSGLMCRAIDIDVTAGDYIEIENYVLDAQTATGIVNADTTFSQIKIDFIEYSIS